ncbi:hypothetical protein RchiOBHm_Chr1g0368451 [Rosa chinensis]|uniref:Uncharacterized protein n=1 Tax=Rosa chinensis TaxID=74649 RepID=A0A2P6SKU1_ROSCH|nr:hypothetical protein RchiOBHm_Chr1g0368451 [Rosa chinensis]
MWYADMDLQGAYLFSYLQAWFTSISKAFDLLEMVKAIKGIV